MAETATKLPVKTQMREAAPTAPRGWPVLENLRQEIDRLFDDFPPSSFRSPFRRPLFNLEPFWRSEWNLGVVPPVDIVEKDNVYEISVELPGMDEKNVEVKYSDGTLTIKGENEEVKEEKKR